MFEKASRFKLRFDSSKGLLPTEDLWDLPLTSARGTSLESIGQDLQSEIQGKSSSTFRIQTEGVTEVNSADTLLNLKFEILKHIVEVRLAENAAERAKTDNKQKKQKLLSLIAQKQDESLASSSVEQLQEMVNAL